MTADDDHDGHSPRTGIASNVVTTGTRAMMAAARARHGANRLRGNRAQASSPAATEEHRAGDLSLAFA
jgi:hypothetical protein